MGLVCWMWAWLFNGHHDINWWGSKAKPHMKDVALIVVAAAIYKAIDFPNLQLQLSEFKDSDSAVTFIHKIDASFDMCNSKNPCGTGSQEPFTL